MDNIKHHCKQFKVTLRGLASTPKVSSFANGKITFVVHCNEQMEENNRLMTSKTKTQQDYLLDSRIQTFPGDNQVLTLKMSLKRQVNRQDRSPLASTNLQPSPLLLLLRQGPRFKVIF